MLSVRVWPPHVGSDSNNVTLAPLLQGGREETLQHRSAAAHTTQTPTHPPVQQPCRGQSADATADDRDLAPCAAHHRASAPRTGVTTALLRPRLAATISQLDLEKLGSNPSTFCRVFLQSHSHYLKGVSLQLDFLPKRPQGRAVGQARAVCRHMITPGQSISSS